MRNGLFIAGRVWSPGYLAALALFGLLGWGTATANSQESTAETSAENAPMAPPEDWDATPQPPRHLADSCEQIHAENREVVDIAREQIEETICGAALWFDGLFGDRRNLSAARGAYGRLETSLEHSSFYGTKSRTRFKVRVDLPNLEQRVSLFIGRDNEENVARDRSEGFALRSEFPELDDRDQFFAGIGYALPGNHRFQSSVRVGVRSVRNPRAFVLSRLSLLAYADERNVISLRLTPFYNTRDGMGVTPGIDYSHVLSPRLLLRWSNVGTWSESSFGFEWRSAVLLYQGFGWGRGLAYEAFVRGATNAVVSVPEYGARLIFRQAVFDGRLFLQPLVGYSWPKEDPLRARDGAYLVGMGVEMPWGHRER
jgi:hypothetical protein